MLQEQVSSMLSSAELSIREKGLLKERARQAVSRQHMRILGSYPEQITIRDLLPADLGLQSWRIPAGTTNWISYKVEGQQSIVLYKVLNLSPDPTISELQIRLGPAGSTTLGIINIESLYSILPVIKNIGHLTFPQIKQLIDSLAIPMEGYFLKPYIFWTDNWININITAYGNKDNHLVIGGYVCEYYGCTIAP